MSFALVAVARSISTAVADTYKMILGRTNSSNERYQVAKKDSLL